MTTPLIGVCAVLGLLIGSFLNVVAHRVPQGASIVSPPSACPSCGHRIRPRDNVPVLGWLLLRGKCRDCGTSISVRYPLVEAGTAVLFAGVAWQVGLTPQLPAFLYLAAIAVALALIDLDVHRLPDVIVLPSYVVAAVLLGVASLANQDAGSAVRAAIGAAALYAVYFAMSFVYPQGMGFGDVKLAGVLGMYLAWLGWPELVIGGFLAFVLGGVVGIALIATGLATRRSRIPFGPFMLAGALLAVVVATPLADWYLGSVVGIV